MRRTALSLAIGIISTGLFVSGLAWIISLRERGWSNHPKTFERQTTFVVMLVAIVIGGRFEPCLQSPAGPILEVSGTKVTEAGKRELQSALPELKILR
jgi:hypothetical protein